MKKLILCAGMLLLISQCSPGSALAASVGPTCDAATPEGGLLEIPKIGKSPLKAAFVYDYENRDLRPKRNDPDLRIHWFLAKLSIDIMDRVEPYIELGSANISTREPVTGGPSGTTRDSFDYGASFAWGLGTKVILFTKKVFSNQEKEMKLFSDTKFRRTRALLDRYISQKITSGDMDMHVFEWQTALGVSQEFKLSKHLTATPYLGAKYSDVDIISDGTAFTASGQGIGGKVRYGSRNKFGPFVGVDIGIGKYMSLSVEGRFADENSVSAGITFRL